MPAKLETSQLPTVPPLYQQIVDELRRDIEENQLAPGSTLPSENELCERFSVSRHTVRQAIRTLKQAGYVESRQGAATRVTKPDRPLYTYSVSSISELFQYASDARYEIEKSAIVTADDELAAKISCTVGSRWLRVEGFRYSKDDPVPFCWTEVFILSEYSGVAVHIGRLTGTVYSFIESMYGVRVNRVDQSLFTAPMPEQALATLGGEKRAIVIRRVYKLADSSVPLIAMNYHSPPRLKLDWILHRSALSAS